MTRSKWILYAGDILAIAILTLIGFTAHGEADIAFLWRMAALFFPLIVSWFFVAPWLGLFQKEIFSNPKQLWRPAVAMLLAVPLAAVLRALLLNIPIIPIFAVFLGGISALAITLWRTVWYWISKG